MDREAEGVRVRGVSERGGEVELGEGMEEE